MAGEVTWKRTSPGWTKLHWKFRRFSGPLFTEGDYPDGSPYTAFTPTQETTSFRSGRTELPSDEDQIPDSKPFAATRQFVDEYRKSNHGRPWDTGHPFKTRNHSMELSHPNGKLMGPEGYGNSYYEGPLIPDFPRQDQYMEPGSYHYPAVGALNSSYYGPRAIAMSSPTNPVSDLAVTLAEIKREGIAKLPGHETYLMANQMKKGPMRSSAGEYLNLEFGWKPLVSATVDTLNAVLNASRIIRQYQRDSGKVIRRRYSFPTQTSSQTFYSGDIARGLYLPDGGTNGSISAGMWDAVWKNGVQAGPFTETITTTRDVSFSGAYSYHLPQGNSLLDDFKRYEQYAHKLLGLRLSPDVLWELSPWSWLADWNGNLGANLKNASMLQNDGLVIRYGYLMTTTVVKRTVSVQGLSTVRGGNLGTVSATYTTTDKVRERANPFGWGSNPASFTGRQWAILGALGITKAPGILRRF